MSAYWELCEDSGVLQGMFESKMKMLSSTDGGSNAYSETLASLVQEVSCVGYLAVRKLVPLPAVVHIVRSLISNRHHAPDTTLITAACGLLQHVGRMMDADERGKEELDEMIRMIVAVAESKDTNLEATGGSTVRDAIEALRYARSSQWLSKYEAQVLV